LSAVALAKAKVQRSSLTVYPNFLAKNQIKKKEEENEKDEKGNRNHSYAFPFGGYLFGQPETDFQSGKCPVRGSEKPNLGI